MTNLETCRLSAKALGHQPDEYTKWSPFTNAEQRWECVEWLRQQGYGISIGNIDYHELIPSKEGQDNVVLECPASDFPALAVAELQARKDKL